jgi:hypothetical protein
MFLHIDGFVGLILEKWRVQIPNELGLFFKNGGHFFYSIHALLTQICNLRGSVEDANLHICLLLNARFVYPQ